MYELIQVSDRTYYIQSPSKIGLFRINDTDVCLIDSGNDKDAGKKALRHINENGWKLTAIYNTHSHADHIGGNRYLQAQTGCKIYAPGIECDFTNHPILEPSFLYGGYPNNALRHKFLLAENSCALPLTSEVVPQGFEIISLPGHSFDMAGFLTPDGVLFAADALSSRETIDKYRIGFIYDVGEYIKTLEKLKAIDAKLFVPSHATPSENISELADYNISSVLQTAEKIADICKEPAGFEEILKAIFDDYALTMSFEQHVLIGSTVRSYLSWLAENGRLEPYFCNNIMLWKQK